MNPYWATVLLLGIAAWWITQQVYKVQLPLGIPGKVLEYPLWGAIAGLVGDKLSPGYILPEAMDFRVPPVVAEAVARAAMETGTARIMPDDLFNVYDITGPGYSNYKP